MNNNKIKKTKSERAVFIFYFCLFSIFSLIFLYPIFWTFCNSLKSGAEFFENSAGLPKEWRIENYARVFTDFRYKQYNYFDMLFNSLWMMFLKIAVNLMSSVILAYPISKFKFPGKELLYGLVIFANTIPLFGTGTTAYKLLSSLNMINNPFLIWLSWASGFDFAFIVFYGTFKGISDSYIDAASIDGANNATTFFKIMLPQAIPSIVALAITQAIPAWNDYQTSMIYMREFPNLAYGLYLFSKESNYIQDSKAIYFCAVVISMLPPLILYGSNQKFILSNISAGGLKG